MKELTGNLWDFHAQGHYICITTNGTVRSDGACVMGRGIAKQAANKFPQLPYQLGSMLKKSGTNCVRILVPSIIAFPVKHHWREEADIELIHRSSIELVRVVTELGESHIYLPRPGCGNGRLTWDVVRSRIAPILDDRFTVVEIHP